MRLAGFGGELAGALAESGLPVRWIIADDGSDAGEHVALERLCGSFRLVYPGVSLHYAKEHRGKGAVLREAWALAADAAWVAFVDADGSVSAREMLGLIQEAVAGGISVVGVRKRTATTRVAESFWRGLAHRGYLLAARWLLGLRSADIQCGAKVFDGDAYRRIAPILMENGLAIDSEMLAAMDKLGLGWRETAVNWTEKDSGKVRVSRDAWGMLCALWRVRRRLR